jgi:hypothetical protein
MFVREPNFRDVVDASKMTPAHARLYNDALKVLANEALYLIRLLFCNVDQFASVTIEIIVVQLFFGHFVDIAPIAALMSG